LKFRSRELDSILEQDELDLEHKHQYKLYDNLSQEVSVQADLEKNIYKTKKKNTESSGTVYYLDSPLESKSQLRI